MNRTELEARIAEQTGLPRAQVQKVLVAYEDSICASLKNGQRVRLVGFGSFVVQERKERQGRNPKTGESITIPATRRPVFKASKAFTSKINKIA